jgi:electron transfer flavoprotein alpha subunit
MSGILVLAEHRKGNILDVTWEILSKAIELSSISGNELTVAILGSNIKSLAEKLASRVKIVWLVDDARLANYNSEIYCQVLESLINEKNPVLTLIGHTAFGMDLAPRLATRLNLPLSTACIELKLNEGKLTTVRQMYDGKVNADIAYAGSSGYVATVRPGSFTAEGPAVAGGEIKEVAVTLKDAEKIKFIESVEAALGGIDITQADILVSVGNGIGDKKNIPMMEELATILGARLSCSRPIVDKKWLPKEHQVGSSGKTVKPKVYLAIGISGSFQHLMGLKGGTIIAINKDPKAPIFRVADYGIVGDLFQVVPVLKEKARGLRKP